MREAASNLGMKALALAVLLVAGWILFKVVLGFLTGLAWVLLIIGALIAAAMLLKRPVRNALEAEPDRGFARVLYRKWYVDEIYDAALIHPIEGASREGFWKIIDKSVIDGGLHAIGNAVTESPEDVYFKQASQTHRNYIRDEKCPTCLSPCQMNVAAIKQVMPYARFLVRASMEKRRAGTAGIAAQPA